jgi:hypothetical protein
MSLIPFSEARNACNFEFLHLKFTTNSDGSYKEENTRFNVSTIPVLFISYKDNEETPSAEFSVINNIVRILEYTEFKHQST